MINQLKSWIDIRGRGWGMIAFLLNRITGLGLVLYLILHFILLSLLAVGEESWDAFVRIAKSPLFLFFDIVLILGALIHGLNGIRVTLTGFGIGVRYQRGMFFAFLALAVALTAILAVQLWMG